MTGRVKLPLIAPQEAQAPGRRAVLRGILGSMGAGFVIPGLAAGHPIHEHLKDQAKLAAAATKAAEPATKPEFLDSHQLQTLVSLAEQIVPRSTEANVAPFIDQLLAVDTQDNQRDFLAALGAFDAESTTRFGHPWKALSAEQQVELLTAASTAKLAQEERIWTPGQPAATPPSPPPPPTLRDRFENLKGWIVGAYYSSEIGMRELGWTGNMFFESFPGCQHPGGHS